MFKREWDLSRAFGTPQKVISTSQKNFTSLLVNDCVLPAWTAAPYTEGAACGLWGPRPAERGGGPVTQGAASGRDSEGKA